MRTREEMAQPAQTTTTRRSAGAVVLAIPLLAVLVLAGLGAAGSLRAGARAERVRGLLPYTGALTNLVHELQRERSLSADASAGPALEGARRTVDGAAADYRDAAVRVEISDRDRRLHQRLDTGLAQLAGLTTLGARGHPPRRDRPCGQGVPPLHRGRRRAAGRERRDRPVRGRPGRRPGAGRDRRHRLLTGQGAGRPRARGGRPGGGRPPPRPGGAHPAGLPRRPPGRPPRPVRRPGQPGAAGPLLQSLLDRGDRAGHPPPPGRPRGRPGPGWVRSGWV